jgi:GNAT superfamily N-acetyltransferase
MAQGEIYTYLSRARILHWKYDRYEIDTDPNRLDFQVIHGFLQTSYWAAGRPLEEVVTGWRNSQTVFGVYESIGGAQVGGARVVGDKATFGWLADVFILPAHRGIGLGKFLIACVVEEPSVHATKRLVLGTRDAHELYKQYGWQPLAYPERWMMRGVQALENSNGDR